MGETFGEMLRRLRLEAGLSQVALARKVHLSQSRISRYEKGEPGADPITAARLDTVLGADGVLRALLPEREPTLNADQRERLAYSVKHPERIDRAAVDAFAQSLAAQRRLDDVLGAELLIAPTLSQTAVVKRLLRDARGVSREALAPVAAEYVQFAGWLHAEARRDADAVRLLTEAEELADEAENGTLAAQAANFKGYLARQQGRPRAIVRWFLAAHHTPGAHASQRIGDAAQAAQGYAQLGERDEALRLLDGAGDLLDDAGRDAPPGTAYWLTPTFHRLNIGLAHLALGEHGDAADHLAAGLAGLPEDQQQAEWVVEYQHAHEAAEERR
ncbi:helix-turn-helix transcriptional regulator [Amycolatopsis sp. CA-230715]|uniref:helix-turn-helix transcriptional regulator n=1 Tax=Amycolatopsis sp. CA-230715 TaxID=2745196 RepID=UPI001C00E86E|nr:helix-turn-helix transcriptional regulator [Amycolatopsis sp. CA-230715]QWF81119.1 hypothetical protein HUW46_04545 [Amycolatopsis sp. CA-230715]